MGSPHAGLHPPSPGPAGSTQDEFEEVSLVDVVRVIHRRKAVLATIVMLSLVGGAALTLLTPKEYESTAEIIPLEHEGIIKNWLESRQAGQFAAATVGAPLYAELFSDSWDTASMSWSSAPPTQLQVAQALSKHVRIDSSSRDANALSVTVTLTDPVLAANVAGGYIDSLTLLRPELENITRSALFDKYYDGTNAQEAQGRAERAAAEKSYWITFDSPTVPEDPVRPRPVLTMALAGVLGVMGGVFLVFGLEWLEKYKAEFGRVSPPPKP